MNAPDAWTALNLGGGGGEETIPSYNVLVGHIGVGSALLCIDNVGGAFDGAEISWGFLKVEDCHLNQIICSVFYSYI